MTLEKLMNRESVRAIYNSVNFQADQRKRDERKIVRDYREKKRQEKDQLRQESRRRELLNLGFVPPSCPIR